jgi:hypothetical protein
MQAAGMTAKSRACFRERNDAWWFVRLFARLRLVCVFGHLLAGILDITKLLYDAITALERASSESQARPPLPRANKPEDNPDANKRTNGRCCADGSTPRARAHADV